MKKIIQSVFLFVILLNITQSAQSQGMGVGSRPTETKPILTAEQIAKNFLPGVVLIVCEDGKGNVSQGSGFFISPGLVLTNAHVVKGMSRGVIITTATNTTKSKTFLVNTILYFNSQETDLALLGSNEGIKEPTTVLPLAKSNDISIGETVYVLGNPEGLIGSISQGIVSSGIRRIGKMNLLQITAPISSGSSGGAVMNSRGEVIGMATSSLVSGQNLNFAVPATQIGQFLTLYVNDKSVTYSPVDKIPNSWKVPEAFLLARKENPVTKIPPPVSGKDSQPTLKETTVWLTDKITGTSVLNPAGSKDSGSNNSEKYERLRFSECKMYLDGVFLEEIEGDELTTKFSYSPNLNFLSSVEVYTKTTGANGVWLKFSKNIAENKSYYYYGYNKLKKPNKTESNVTDTIVIFTQNRDSAERISKAFTRLIELCGEKTKVPF